MKCAQKVNPSWSVSVCVHYKPCFYRGTTEHALLINHAIELIYVVLINLFFFHLMKPFWSNFELFKWYKS